MFYSDVHSIGARYPPLNTATAALPEECIFSNKEGITENWKLGIIETMKDMLGRENVVDAETALGLLIGNLSADKLSDVRIKIEDALGMVSAHDIISAEDLPSFVRSTVDGYAVRAGDTFGATETMPVYLNLFHEVLMSQKADFRLPDYKASKIPTGGMLPENADAVVMFEHVQIIDEQMIEVLRPVAPGDNVVQVGEDVKIGDVVIREGQRMRPQDIGACAGIGVTEIAVYKRPSVSIISTGDEIVAANVIPGSRKGQGHKFLCYLRHGPWSAAAYR